MELHVCCYSWNTKYARRMLHVSTWKYQTLVWHVAVSAWNDIVIYTDIVKYRRYMSHFIGLVHINDLVVINTWSCPMHICMLQVSRLWWYAKFACYSCCIEWHWLVRFGYHFFAFLLCSLQIWVSISVPISLAFVGFTNFVVLRKFAGVSSSWTATHMRGVLQIGVYLYNQLLGNSYVKSSPHLH